ncbi:exported hypothetical protein [Xenorhabdus bovienii str. kraussei Becker Underwood]|uniref:Uncharacterized protein n=1 Tax=Xenorhabdus bovienii str. kraussei Becker Underwood TaxID=1398204 RepID=A0A077PZA2_XENBV|nr:exported hypothetical protein [Xenorhabdus bovienii str. kraussei Becker Underwood]
MSTLLLTLSNVLAGDVNAASALLLIRTEPKTIASSECVNFMCFILSPSVMLCGQEQHQNNISPYDINEVGFTINHEFFH